MGTIRGDDSDSFEKQRKNEYFDRSKKFTSVKFESSINTDSERGIKEEDEELDSTNENDQESNPLERYERKFTL